MSKSETTTTRQQMFFMMSLMIALGYGLLYFRAEIGVSPFHISARLPGLDVMILLATVVLPLVVGTTLGLLSGRLKWYVLPVYPIVLGLSLFES